MHLPELGSRVKRSAGICLTALATLLAPGSGGAQMRLDVSGVGAAQYPVAVANFASDGRAGTDVAAVVRTDLARSGSFRIVELPMTISDTGSIDYARLRELGADAVLGGSIARLADGRYDIRDRLTDTVRQLPLGGEAVIASEADLRYAAHRIADFVYEKLTGEKGIFSTRIAYISKQGSRYRLNIADWDGENVQASLTSSEPIISPSWSADGKRIAYVSFESGKPVVYVHDIASGKRRAVANFRGSNSAPAWSPDGKKLAVALTRDGLSQVYLISTDGTGTPRRLISSSGIDTEPFFSADGQYLYFSSDRGGSPQVYRIPANGGDATRVTFGSNYNSSPRISPDGRTLAFVTRRDGRYYVAIKDLVGDGKEELLSQGGNEEAPSFAPNSRWVMYATKIGGRDMLIAASIDGRVKQRLSAATGDIREPTWSPYAR